MSIKTILFAVVVFCISQVQTNAQELSSADLKDASTEIKKLIQDGELESASDGLTEATRGPIEPMDAILMETLRLKIAQKYSIAKDYENSQIEFLQSIKFMSTHLEYPLAQNFCVSAFEGFNNLVRIGKAKQIIDELAVYSVNTILEQEADGETTATSQRAGRLAASYADTDGKAENRAELLAIIERQLIKLKAAYKQDANATNALALSSFQNAKAKFYSAKHPDNFNELSMEQESFLTEALAQFPDSYALSHELAKITILRVSRIGRSHTESAKSSVDHTIKALSAAKETLGTKVNHHIQSIERVAKSLPNDSK